jgi:hypothetical protein
MTVRKSHRQPQRTLQIVYEDRVLFVWVDLHVSLREQQHPNCKQAIRLVYTPFFRTLRSASNPQTKISRSWVWGLKQHYIGSHWELSTCSYELLFLQWPLLSPPKIFTFLPESLRLNLILLLRYLVKRNDFWLSPTHFEQACTCSDLYCDLLGSKYGNP